MKLIIGLGNSGDKYEGTRHNVGSQLLMQLGSKSEGQSAKSHNLKFQTKSGLFGEVCKMGEVILARPTTFMNESGKSVGKLVSYYKVKLMDLYMVYDDLDLRLGEYKIQFGKGPKDHNGVNSVVSSLGTDQFWHMRIGVDNRNVRERTPGEEYVLNKFSDQETDVLEGVLERASEELTGVLK